MCFKISINIKLDQGTKFTKNNENYPNIPLLNLINIDQDPSTSVRHTKV